MKNDTKDACVKLKGTSRMVRTEIIPSIITDSQAELEKKIATIGKNAKTVQLDIMDGQFVRNKSLWFDFTLPKSTLRYEVQLLVKNPGRWITRYGAKVDRILFHLETTKSPHELIRLIKQKNKQVGVAITPETPVKDLVGVIDFVDQVTIMTVHPGRYGAKFLPKMLDKVRFLRGISKKVDIEVDGGINDKTILLARNAGANKFITGSYLQKQASIKEGIRKLRNLLRT